MAECSGDGFFIEGPGSQEVECDKGFLPWVQAFAHRRIHCQA